MLEFIVSKVATILTLGMFSSGIHTVQKIKMKGTGDTPILPFVAMATSGFLWFNYGIMKGDGSIAFVNFIGCILNCIYVLLYYWYTPNKTNVYRTVGGFILMLLGIHMYSAWMHTHPDEAINFIGLVGVFITVGMFASPLAQLRIVMETESTESMSFPLAILVCLQSVMWWWYGVIKDDGYIQFPNVCGTVLGLFQVGVFLYYWNSKPKNVSNIMSNV